jgi:drug/metabolite transporter (DMT)-like permease
MENKSVENNNTKWYILIILAIVWGSSFILMKKGLDSGLSPLALGSLRILFTSVFLLIIGYKHLQTIKKEKVKHIVLAGILGNFFPIYFFALAQTQISSSISSTLNSFTPLNTLIIGSIFFGLTFKKNQIYGLILGIIGCVILVYAGATSNPSKNYWFALFVIVSSWCYATNINMVKKHLSDVSPMAITIGNFTILAIPALLVLCYVGLSPQFFTLNNWFPFICVAVLGVVGTGLANIYFYKLIQMSSTVFASNVTYLIPIVATFWSIVDHENVTIFQIIGTLIILFGVYITNRK